MKASKQLAILLLSLTLGCSSDEDKSGWFIDSSFTDRLVSHWEEHPIITQQDPSTSVDSLQIFRAPKGNQYIYTVNEIRSKDLIYETTKPEDILALFRATRAVVNDSCDSTEYDFVYFILAFDRDLMRVGFVKYFPCKRNGLGYYQKWKVNSIYFSSELANLIEKIVPPKLGLH